MARFRFTAALVLLIGSFELNALEAAQAPSTDVDTNLVANFYRGKVIRIVVGFPPGGGADVYSRLIARHLGRFIPSNPTLAVTNMAGAGSIVAGNHVFNRSARSCATARARPTSSAKSICCRPASPLTAPPR